MLAIPCIVSHVRPVAEAMASMLAGPVRWIPDLPACLPSPWVVRLVPAISSVSEAEVAVSVWPAGEVSSYRGAVVGSLPGICEPLNRTCMQPQRLPVQWNGLIIISPKEQGSREQVLQ